MMTKDTSNMTLQEFSAYAKVWLGAVKEKHKDMILIFTVDEFLTSVCARVLCEACQGLRSPIEFLDVPVSISFEDKTDLEKILGVPLCFNTDYKECGMY